MPESSTQSVQHTPGPWRYEPDFKEIQAGPLSAYKILAQVSPENRPGDFIDDDETEANARLIAAGPDLLAVLEQVVAWSKRTHSLAGDTALGVTIRRAIAKAEGRS